MLDLALFELALCPHTQFFLSIFLVTFILLYIKSLNMDKFFCLGLSKT